MRFSLYAHNPIIIGASSPRRADMDKFVLDLKASYYIFIYLATFYFDAIMYKPTFAPA